MGNPGVAKVVDLGAGDTSFSVVAVDGGPDVSNQQGFTGFGNKKCFVGGFGTNLKVSSESRFDRFI